MDAVIFDLDGTLWDAMEPIFEAWKEALRRTAARHIDLTEPVLRSWMGKTPKEISALAFPDEPQAVQMAEMQKLYDYENELLRHRGGRLYPQLREVLKTLEARYALFLVSNSQDGYVQAFLDWSGLHCFRDYEMAGRTGLDKGENIRLVMARNGVRQAVYVGDTQGDADAAKKAGVPLIFAAYGFGRVADAEYVIQEISELPSILEQIFSP